MIGGQPRREDRSRDRDDDDGQAEHGKPALEQPAPHAGSRLYRNGGRDDFRRDGNGHRPRPFRPWHASPAPGGQAGFFSAYRVLLLSQVRTEGHGPGWSTSSRRRSTSRKIKL